MRESDIQARILNVLRRLTFIRADRNNTGKLSNPDGRHVSFGQKGSADVLVHVKPICNLLGLEVKTPTKEETDAQLAWADDIRAKGGFVFRVRDEEAACGHVREVYRRNLDLLRRAGDLTEAHAEELLASADAEIAKARAAASEAEDRRATRKGTLPKRKPLPDGTNSGARF